MKQQGDSKYESKECPICHALCFSDMEVCYGCLHRFSESDLNVDTIEKGAHIANTPKELSSENAFLSGNNKEGKNKGSQMSLDEKPLDEKLLEEKLMDKKSLEEKPVLLKPELSKSLSNDRSKIKVGNHGRIEQGTSLSDTNTETFEVIKTLPLSSEQALEFQIHVRILGV